MVVLIKPLILSMVLSAGLNCEYGAPAMDSISAELQEAFKAAPDTPVDVVITCRNICRPLIKKLVDTGAEVKDFWPELNLISARLSATQAQAIATDKDVEMIELDAEAQIQ